MYENVSVNFKPNYLPIVWTVLIQYMFLKHSLKRKELRTDRLYWADVTATQGSLWTQVCILVLLCRVLTTYVGWKIVVCTTPKILHNKKKGAQFWWRSENRYNTGTHSKLHPFKIGNLILLKFTKSADVLSVYMVCSSHYVRWGDYGVIKSCRDLASRHDRLHIGPWPIIAGCYSQHAWFHWIIHVLFLLLLLLFLFQSLWLFVFYQTVIIVMQKMPPDDSSYI